MTRTLVALLLACLAAAAMAAEPATDEINALSLYAGTRQVDHQGQPVNDSHLLNDGVATRHSQFEVSRTGEPTLSLVFQLAEPYDLHRLEAVNSFEEDGYPGISTRRLRLEHGPSHEGPWTPVTEVELAKGTKPQGFAFPPVKNVRYLRVTFLENYGEERWWNLAELAVYGRRVAERGAADFSGTWETTYGFMHLTQEGERVYGCYGSEGANLVDGVVDGQSFYGSYTEGNTVGPMSFVMTVEGEMSGIYGTGFIDPTRYRWDAVRTNDAQAINCGGQADEESEGIADELANNGRVVLRGILFDTGKDVIKPESIPVLEELAEAIRKAGGRYLIEGHTDNRGGEAFNQTLSEKRAESVKRWLVEHGIDAAALSTEGHGMSRPAMPNDTDAGRAANRRVEVVKL